VGFSIALLGQSKLQALYVHPEYSGHGIGISLLNAIEERCRAVGIDALEVKASYNAESFYRRNGYEAVRGTMQSLADGSEMGAVLMTKRLRKPPRLCPQ
jgi:putative acetyltransferase